LYIFLTLLIEYICSLKAGKAKSVVPEAEKMKKSDGLYPAFLTKLSYVFFTS